MLVTLLLLASLRRFQDPLTRDGAQLPHPVETWSPYHWMPGNSQELEFWSQTE